MTMVSHYEIQALVWALEDLWRVLRGYLGHMDLSKKFPTLYAVSKAPMDPVDHGALFLELTAIRSLFKSRIHSTGGVVPEDNLVLLDKVHRLAKNLPATSGASRVASRFLSTASPSRVASRSKVAGEVRFIKDKSNDANGWAWNDTGPQERKITPDFAFNPKNTKPLARVLRATNAAMGHAVGAYNIFTKLKSADVSPDGSLGGKGYIQKISEMRRAYMNVVEALSSLSDTIYDEIRAPHWAAVSRQEDPEERKEVEDIVEEAMEIKDNPEEWAQEQEEEMDKEIA